MPGWRSARESGCRRFKACPPMIRFFPNSRLRVRVHFGVDEYSTSSRRSVIPTSSRILGENGHGAGVSRSRVFSRLHASVFSAKYPTSALVLP